MTISISTVTPVYNGAQYLPNLIEELGKLRTVLNQKKGAIEFEDCIFVVNGPVDESAEILEQFSKHYKWVKVITLSKNFGQHPATIVGMLNATGDWVITLDEDLQHHPKHIPALLETATENRADICYAKAINNAHNSFIRDRLSALFKSVMSRILDNPNAKHFNSFRAIRGDIARGVAAVCRHDTYLDVALGWHTDAISIRDVDLYDERNQKSGQSGYSFFGLVRHAKRMIMSSKIKFLRLAMPVGIIAFLTSLFIALYMIVTTALGMNTVAPRGWTTIILLNLSFGGLAIFLLSVILESIGDLMLYTNGKPTYFIVDRSSDPELKQALKKIDISSVYWSR